MVAPNLRVGTIANSGTKAEVRCSSSNNSDMQHSASSGATVPSTSSHSYEPNNPQPSSSHETARHSSSKSRRLPFGSLSSSNSKKKKSRSKSRHKSKRKDTKTPTSNSTNATDDTNILKGAEIIRQQIRKQLEAAHEGGDVRIHQARDVRDTLLQGDYSDDEQGAPNDHRHRRTAVDMDSDINDEDQFSDPWLDQPANQTGCRKMSDDSSTIFRDLPSMSGGGSAAGSSYGDGDEDGINVEFSDLSTILECTAASSPTDKSTNNTKKSHPTRPNVVEDDDGDDDYGYGIHNTYSPLSVLGKHNDDQQTKQKKTSNSFKSQKSTSLRALRKQRGLLDDDDEEESYGFVGEDYDSDLDQDDHFNSSNIDSYLPFHLRKNKKNGGGGKKAGKTWSPTTVSTTTSGSPQKKMKSIKPRKLDASWASSSLYSSPDPPIPSKSTRGPSPATSTVGKAADKSRGSSREQSSHVSPRSFFLPFRLSHGSPPASSSNKSPNSPTTYPKTSSKSKTSSPNNHNSKLHYSTPSPPETHPMTTAISTPQYISRSSSERTDRELCPSPPSSLQISDLVPSPLSIEYDMLLHDPAFCHAQRAGLLWQSLVGQQVRFPSRWWNGARSPPMGIVIANESHDEHRYYDLDDDTDTKDGLYDDAKWEYLPPTHVSNNRSLNRLIRNRATPGRLLLHAIVLHQGIVVADFCVGVCHPNARGIRDDKSPTNPQMESVRILWAALRKRTKSCTLLRTNNSNATTNGHRDVSDDEREHRMELGGGASNKDASQSSFTDRYKTPLGYKRRITNQNVRAVYGERPPMETVFMPQWELEQRLAQQPTPVWSLVQEFVFD